MLPSVDVAKTWSLDPKFVLPPEVLLPKSNEGAWPLKPALLIWADHMVASVVEFKM